MTATATAAEKKLAREIAGPDARPDEVATALACVVAARLLRGE